MARIRFNKEWFPELSPKALYESEFESVFVQNAEILRAKAIVVPFKQTVYAGPYDSARADLALVDGDYREWWVIELELIHHDLFGHVLPQVRTLAEGRYGSEHVAALARFQSLDPQRLAKMIKGEPPRVLVVCNRYRDDWARELRALGVSYVAFSIFRSNLNKDVFLLEGELPTPSAEIVTRLTPATGIPRFLKIHSPAMFPDEGIVKLMYEGKLTDWVKIDTADQSFLTSKGRFPIQIDRPFVVVRGDDGTLLLQEERGGRVGS